jgi:CRISPR-associated endonuclease/helicase Cas3
MYELIDTEYLLDGETYHAHTKKNDQSKKELLLDHMALTIKYFELYCKKKNLMTIIKTLIRKSGFNDDEAKIILNLFVNAIYLHDIGKINPDFQRKKMGNKKFKLLGLSTEHSIYSSLIYIGEILKRYPKLNRKCFMTMLAFAYIISCHHGRLLDAREFEDKLRGYSDNGFYYFDIDLLDCNNNIGLGSVEMKTLFNNNSEGIAFFILLRLLYSMITACDFCATTEFMNDTKYEISVIDDIESFSARYYESKLLQKIRSYKRKCDISKIESINDLRTEIFLETENSLIKNKTARIFYLEAPTGSGKTNTSINLALRLLSEDRALNNIFYIFPFNTLVEQTAIELSKHFNNDSMAIVNSITPITSNDRDDETDYNTLWLNRLFNNYPLVITTHVNFFDALFGTDREQIFPLLKFANSVIIIDEIQSYKNHIWPEIIIFLSAYANLLNMRIIIMSATLPRIDKVFAVDNIFAELLEDSQKYYRHRVFRERVRIDTSLMDNEELSLQTLLEHVLTNKGKKILVEFITKTGARDFFNIIKDSLNESEADHDIEVYELSGDDCSLTRKLIIDKAKSGKPIILITTQVIEAGIDIDMDIGYKEISLPDSEEQFLGRINRSFGKTGCAGYFFNRTKPEVIYKGDCRVNHSINDVRIFEYLMKKDFSGMYTYILNDLKVKREQKNSLNINTSISLCQTLDFEKVERKMQLISPSMQIYVPYIIMTEDAKRISGYEIWDEYKHMCKASYDFAEKKVRLSGIRTKMDPFIFNLTNSNDQAIGLQLKEFGGIYFVEEGERFIDNGKFDRKAFNAYYKGRFL